MTGAPAEKVVVTRSDTPRACISTGGGEASASFKAISWNVAGLRKLVEDRPHVLKKVIDAEQPEVLAMMV